MSLKRRPCTIASSNGVFYPFGVFASSVASSILRLLPVVQVALSGVGKRGLAVVLLCHPRLAVLVLRLEHVPRSCDPRNSSLATSAWPDRFFQHRPLLSRDGAAPRLRSRARPGHALGELRRQHQELVAFRERVVLDSSASDRAQPTDRPDSADDRRPPPRPRARGHARRAPAPATTRAAPPASRRASPGRASGACAPASRSCGAGCCRDTRQQA